MNAIDVQNLNVGYQQKAVLTELNLQIPAGKTTAIIGPNGAGKSTLLKALMKLTPRQSGKVRFFEEPLKQQALSIAYVPQREEVDWDFPICVLDVVLMGRHGHLKFWQRPSKQDIVLANQCLKDVGMDAFSQRQISQLSGGQQQRVFIARALVQQAQLYLMDEPFAGVDMATEKAIIQIFRRLKSENKTVVCVHHDLNTLRDYFDWVVMINGGLVASGSIEQTLTIENLDKTYQGRLPMLEKLTEGL